MSIEKLDYNYIFSIKKLLNIICNTHVKDKSVISVPKIKIYNCKVNVRLINRTYSYNLLEFYKDYYTPYPNRLKCNKLVDSEAAALTTFIKNADKDEYISATKVGNRIALLLNIEKITKTALNETKIIEVNSFNFNMMKNSFEQKFFSATSKESIRDTVFNWMSTSGECKTIKPEIIMLDHYNIFKDNVSAVCAKDTLPVRFTNTVLIYKREPVWFRENYGDHTFEKGERFVRIDDTITIISDNKDFLSSLELEFTI